MIFTFEIEDTGKKNSMLCLPFVVCDVEMQSFMCFKGKIVMNMVQVCLYLLTKIRN